MNEAAEKETTVLKDWFRSMRTIIILLVLSPFVALVAVGGTGSGTLAPSIAALGAMVIGFPVDWWRLQKRRQRRNHHE